MTDERYPIGRFTPVPELSPADRNSCIEQIAAAPVNFRRAVAGLNDTQLDTPYRAGGWTVRQVAHHLPDSHMNAYMRFKWGLTEDTPSIKTYEEKDWAKTPEMRAPIAMSLDLLTPRHASSGFCPHDQASGVGHTVARYDARALRVARPASHRPRHDAAAPHGLGRGSGRGRRRLMVDFGDENLDEEFPLGDGTADAEGIVVCPYCGEPNEIGIDAGGGAYQDYVEDCQVCCRPWRVTVAYDEEGNAEILASPLDE